MGTIDRGSSANTFVDQNLKAGTKLVLPIKESIPDFDESGSLGLGPNGLLMYKDQEGLTQEVPIETGTSINDAVISTTETWSSKTISDKLSALQGAVIGHPTYAAPSASLSANPATSGIEVGQTIAVTLTAAFTQRNAGAQTALSIMRDGAQIATTSPYTDQGIVISTVPRVYTARINYAQGAVLNDALGTPDPVGRIPAGSVTTNSISYRGYYRAFFGFAAAEPTNSATARALPQNQLVQSAGKVIINSGTEMTKQFILVPPGYSLSGAVDLDASLAVVNFALINSNFIVNDVAGAQVAGYKLYTRTQGVPYTTNHRLELTLTAV